MYYVIVSSFITKNISITSFVSQLSKSSETQVVSSIHPNKIGLDIIFRIDLI